jgi:ABC-type dipeptide/oligopeptide/nickel transport system permease subunit
VSPSHAWGRALVVLVTFTALAGPWLVDRSPIAQDLSRVLEGPSWSEPMGTDPFGRSVFSRMIHGARHSLLLALACVGLSAGTGIILGIAAGFKRGKTDVVIMRLVDGLLAFPGILLAVVVAGWMGGGRWPLILALAATGWCDYARLARNMVRRILAEDYVQAGRLLGFSDFFLARKYVAGRVWPHLRTLAGLGIGRTILHLSAFGFLGIGLKPPTPEWGAMITQALPYLGDHPHLALAPGGAIFLTVLGFNLLSLESKKHYA